MKWQQWLWLILVIVPFILAGQSWFTYRYFTSRYPGGNDFYPRWAAGCAILWTGENPYSEAVTRRTQIGLLGHPARPGEDQAAYAYPLYTLILYWPLCFLRDYALARAVWMTLTFYALMAGTILTLNLSGWRPSPPLLGATVLWAGLAYAHVRAIVLGQIATPVFLVMMAAIWAASRGYTAWAGVMLALSTIKPQMSFLLIAWLLWWGAWRRQCRLWTAFGLTLLLLTLAAMTLVPTWPLDFLSDLITYRRSWLVDAERLPPEALPPIERLAYKSLISILVHLVLHWPTAVEIVGLAGGAAFAGWMAWRNRYAEGRAFLWTTGWMLTLTHFLTPVPATTHYSILMLPFFLSLARLERERAAWGWMTVTLIVPWAVFLLTLQGDVESFWAYLPQPLIVLGMQVWTKDKLSSA